MVSAANLWIDLCSAYSLLTPFPRSVAGYTYSGYVGGLPDCVPCTNQSACAPGFYAPPCLATDGPQPCLPCAAPPPANASFSVGCSVACDRGFYNLSGTCVPCSATCPANQIPILCGGDSPPTCMSCYSTYTYALSAACLWLIHCAEQTRCPAACTGVPTCGTTCARPHRAAPPCWALATCQRHAAGCRTPLCSRAANRALSGRTATAHAASPPTSRARRARPCRQVSVAGYSSPLGML